ncbi:sensor histidine kinase [Glycomyces salinus]|uniref:sensor histidine kinase n=1 Tax=Glycomyces salinus TaxID=980294 RepID=UPI0018EDA300|nr:sensor histidine kinase [Glycomyces salinus]
MTADRGPAPTRARWREAAMGPLRPVTWRRTLHALLDLPVGLAGWLYATACAFAAVLVPVGVGLPLLAAGIIGARAWAGLERGRARRLIGVRVDGPTPLRPEPPGLFGWTRAALRDGPGWRSLGYLLLLGLWSVPAAALGFACAVVGLALLTYPAWFWLLGTLSDQPGLALGGPGGWRYLDSPAEVAAAAVVGAALLLALSPLTRALTGVDRALVRGLLGPVTLAQRADDLAAGRSSAVASAAEDRRRIERDLHDGAQARMVAVAMDVGMARSKLDSDPASAADLLALAHDESKRAIAELRDLARGIHPPALTDRGLAGALPALASLSRVPVDLEIDIEPRPSASVETVAYYCAAELLTNAGKHAGADRVVIVAARDGDRLALEIRDDGDGGADPRGPGLRGVAHRLRSVDGTMRIDSPAGGPTTIRLEIPCAS